MSGSAELADRAAAVRQRWTLSSVIGRDVKLVKAGAEWDGLCPFHHDTRIGSFKVNDGKGLYKCFACGAHGDVITYLIARKGVRFIDALRQLEAEGGIDFRDAKQRAQFDREKEKRERAAMQDMERRRENARGMWLHGTPGAGTPAQFYLEARGLSFARMGRWPGAIRYRHDATNKETGRKLPCMMTAVQDLSGRHIATHRTFLEYRRGQWGKADIGEPKLTLGSYRGGFIPLWKGAQRCGLKDIAEGTPVYMSEGIEDGLTIAMLFPERRVIAGIAVDNMGGVHLPEQMGDLVLIGQNDPKGSGGDISIERVIEKHQRAGRTVRCLWPDPEYKDFNDQLRGIRMERV